MPTLAVARDFLFGLIGKSYTDTQFEDVCFEFGVELDDITSEREMYMREQGKTAAANATVANAATHAAPEGLSDEVIYKIDTPANRYDLLSAEGMAIALKVFLGTMALPKYRVLNATSPLYRMTVEKSVKGVRDYVVCAVLKNIKFNEHSYNSFIDFQEKLHLGLARRRTLASVGTHDMSKIGAAGTCNSFIYGCRPREQIKFVPLRQTRLLDCTGNGLEAFYADDRHISKYVPIISSLPAFPVILEAERQSVLSLPPVINSDASRIDIHTKDIFIECTATDHYKAQILVNQMVCAFSMYCADPFTIEAVKVDYEEAAPDGTVSLVCPVLEPTEVTVSLQRLNEVIGIHMESPEQCVGYLTKMMYDVKKVDGDAITVEAPAVRSDVLGPPDVLEDVAIGYGYDNIVYTECTTHGDVTQTPVGKVGQLIRTEIANAGYVELLTFSLCSRDEAFAWLGRTDSDTAAHIANPQTIEFQICRPSLMPGLLKTVSANKSLPLPQRYFECADVILIDNATNFPAVLEPVVTDGYPSPGARNQRHLAALHTSSNSSSFEHIHALMEYAFMKLGIYRKGAEPAADYTGDVYTIEKAAAGEDGAFFPGRAMDVYVHRGGQKVKVGGLGVVHPNALKAYDIANPCSYMELNMQFVCVPL